METFLLREDFKCENIPPPADDLVEEVGSGEEPPSNRGLPVIGVELAETLFDAGGDEG